MLLDCPAEQCDYTADARARRPGDKRAMADADGLVSYKHMHYECLIDSRGRRVRPLLCRTVSLSAFWPRHTFKGLVARIVIYPLSPRPNKSTAQDISSQYAVCSMDQAEYHSRHSVILDNSPNLKATFRAPTIRARRWQWRHQLENNKTLARRRG